MLSTAKIGEFRALYGEFVREYLLQPRGQDHLRRYQDGRVQGRRNFEEITAETRRTGTVPTDAVLLKLLPHTDTAAHRKSGAWIYIAPAIQGDIKNWFEKAGWTRAGDWPNIADAILAFVTRCVDNPSTIEAACTEFVSLTYTTGFQTGMLTPILNALDPDEFMIVNNKSRSIVNHLTDGVFKQRLTDYPATNSAARRVVDALQSLMREANRNDAPPADLFDMFCHWLVAEKKELPFYGREGPVRLSGDEAAGTVTVPIREDQDNAVPIDAVAEVQSRESHRIQATLASIGIRMGFQIWAPRNDRSNLIGCDAKLRNSFLEALPLNYIEVTLRTIEQIDVLWIKRHSIVRAFEVEHTTAIYSGLLRMSDLLSLQPDINIRLHIVAPDEKHDKVMREVRRPTFRYLEKGPLHQRCSLLSYGSVMELSNLPHLEYMTDEVLKTYEEFAEGE